MTIRSDRHGMEVQACRPGVTQNITIGAVSALSAAFQFNPDQPIRSDDGTNVNPMQWNHTTHVRLVSTSGCWIAFGPTSSPPVASISNRLSFYLPPNAPEYFWVVPGEQLAVIQDTTGGLLNIAELVQ